MLPLNQSEELVCKKVRVAKGDKRAFEEAGAGADVVGKQNVAKP